MKKKLYICPIVNPQKNNIMSNKKMSLSASSHNSDINLGMCENCLLYVCEDTYPAIFDECVRGILNGFTPKEYATSVEMRIIK